MKVVIVGAGQAGGWFVQTLRDTGFNGDVTLVGEESHPPYQRPPLSKEVLLGTKAPEATYLWPGGQAVEFLMGTRALRIDRAARRLICSDGREINYDKLVLATGGRVRRLDLPGAHYLRTIADAVGLRRALQRGGSVRVIGGGWIGLEAAVAATTLGCTVTVVEAAERLCGRAVPEIMSTYLLDLHQRHGVRVLLNAAAEAIVTDTTVVGIGIEPNVEIAQAAGLAVANGIVVDEFGVTSDPDIIAVGDVANLNGMRLETWANAQNQAIAAAKSLAGTPTPYREIPWFWSTQYDVNMQFLGLPAKHHTIIRRGDPAHDKFTLFFLQDKQLAAVIAVNNMRDIRVARKLMENRTLMNASRLADESIPLQDMLGK